MEVQNFGGYLFGFSELSDILNFVVFHHFLMCFSFIFVPGVNEMWWQFPIQPDTRLGWENELAGK